MAVVEKLDKEEIGVVEGEKGFHIRVWCPLLGMTTKERKIAQGINA
jgi:hypothetical protein